MTPTFQAAAIPVMLDILALAERAAAGTTGPVEVERAALPAFPNDDLGTVQSLEALAAEQEEDLRPLRVRKSYWKIRGLNWIGLKEGGGGPMACMYMWTGLD